MDLCSFLTCSTGLTVYPNIGTIGDKEFLWTAGWSSSDSSGWNIEWQLHGPIVGFCHKVSPLLTFRTHCGNIMKHHETSWNIMKHHETSGSSWTTPKIWLVNPWFSMDFLWNIEPSTGPSTLGRFFGTFARSLGSWGHAWCMASSQRSQKQRVNVMVSDGWYGCYMGVIWVLYGCYMGVIWKYLGDRVVIWANMVNVMWVRYLMVVRWALKIDVTTAKSHGS